MKPARARAPRGQGDLLRDEILAATEALLIETGSEEAVSIRAVAERVGVTAPSIYRHFTDKQRLLFEVCDRQFDRLQVHLQKVMAIEDDPTEQLRACGRAYVEFGLAHPEHYRIMFMGHGDWTPEEYAGHVTGSDGLFGALVQAVADVTESLGIDRDPYQAAVLVWTAVHGITSLLISKPNFPWPDVDQLIDQCCTTQLRGTFGQA